MSHSRQDKNLVSKTKSPLENGQVTFSLQSFLMYLNAAEESRVFDAQTLKLSKVKVNELVDLIKLGKISVEEAIEQFNQTIENFNDKLPKPPQGCGYPPFDRGSTRGQVRAQLIAYQNFLCMEMRAGNISYSDELPVFDETARLWQQIMRRAITPRSGINSLAKLITKTNTKLGAKHHYPIPDEKLYDKE